MYFVIGKHRKSPTHIKLLNSNIFRIDRIFEYEETVFFHFKLDGSRSIIYCVCSVQNCTSRETNGCTVNRIFTKLLTFAFCHLGSSCPSTYCGVKVSSESNSRDEWLVDDCRVGMRRTGSKLLLLCKSSISLNCYFKRYWGG